MSDLPKPWNTDANTRRRRVRSLLLQAASWAPTVAVRATRLGRSPTRALGPDAVDVSNRPPDFANAKACQSSPNYSWPESASEIAAAERFGWYSVRVEGRAKQSLLSNVSVAQPSCVSNRQTSSHRKVPQTRAPSLFFLQSRNSFLATFFSMAGNQQQFGKREQPEE